MKINHIAIRAKDPELLKDFYIKYFDMISGSKYTNAKTLFSSYFLSFRSGDTRIEIMHIPDLQNYKEKVTNTYGIAHIAISAGNRESVNKLTERLKADGYFIRSEPRVTGDGYYESVILDPEENIIEITV